MNIFFCVWQPTALSFKVLFPVNTKQTDFFINQQKKVTYRLRIFKIFSTIKE